jgi:hypothetical protein
MEVAVEVVAAAAAIVEAAEEDEEGNNAKFCHRFYFRNHRECTLLWFL